jgi:predicted DNA-binding transcriptional regulator AlpA
MNVSLMTRSDLMEFLGISPTTLWRLARQADFPRPVLVRGMKRWRRDEVDKWLNAGREVAAAGLSHGG